MYLFLLGLQKLAYYSI